MSHMKNTFIEKVLCTQQAQAPLPIRMKSTLWYCTSTSVLDLAGDKDIPASTFSLKTNKAFLFIISLSFVDKHMNGQVVNIVANSIIFQMVFVTIGKLYRSLWS